MRRTDAPSSSVVLTSPGVPRGRGRGFTLLELLVVVSLLVLLLAVAVPSINAIIRSTEEASARNQLDVAMAAGRSAAITSETGQDAAAVFFFTPGKKTTIGIYRKVGEFKDEDITSEEVVRDVFVPSAIPPFSLPAGWMVRGLAPLGSLHDSGRNDTGWYEPIPGKREFEAGPSGRPWWNWVFPETGFYNPKVGDEVKDQPLGFAVRQTFMVRFEAGTGMVKSGEPRQALVIDPSPSNAFRTQLPYRLYRFNRGEDVGVVVSQVLAVADKDMKEDDKRSLIGDAATDTVLARGVTEIALYREADLAAAIGARAINRVTGSLYGSNGRGATTPEFDVTLFGSFNAAEVARRINEWFASDGVSPDGASEAGAFVFTIDQASGRPTEVR